MHNDPNELRRESTERRLLAAGVVDLSDPFWRFPAPESRSTPSSRRRSTFAA
jgi:hypothetical protein